MEVELVRVATTSQLLNAMSNAIDTFPHLSADQDPEFAAIVLDPDGMHLIGVPVLNKTVQDAGLVVTASVLRAVGDQPWLSNPVLLLNDFNTFMTTQEALTVRLERDGVSLDPPTT